MMGKKGQGVAWVIIIIIIIIILIGWWASVSNRECRGDLDCGPEHYCGSDYRCHQVPVIEKTVSQYDLTKPAVIIGIALVLAAIILRRKKLPYWLIGDK
jgi:hypothetical protein